MPTRAVSLMAFQSRKGLEEKKLAFAARVDAHALVCLAMWPAPQGPHPLGQQPPRAESVTESPRSWSIPDSRVSEVGWESGDTRCLLDPRPGLAICNF